MVSIRGVQYLRTRKIANMCFIRIWRWAQRVGSGIVSLSVGVPVQSNQFLVQDNHDLWNKLVTINPSKQIPSLLRIMCIQRKLTIVKILKSLFIKAHRNIVRFGDWNNATKAQRLRAFNYKTFQGYNELKMTVISNVNFEVVGLMILSNSFIAVATNLHITWQCQQHQRILIENCSWCQRHCCW